MFSDANKANRYLKLARELRYRTLEHVLNRSIQIRSEATVIEDVLAALGDTLPHGLKSVRQPARGLPTVAKYALLDLEFSIPPRDGDELVRPSVKQLRALGLLTGGPTDRA